MSGRSILPVVVYSPDQNRKEKKGYAVQHLMDTASLGGVRACQGMSVCLSTKHSMHNVATVTRKQHMYSIEMGGRWLHVHDIREDMYLTDG